MQIVRNNSAGKFGENPTLQKRNCDVSCFFITNRKGKNSDELSQGAAFCTTPIKYVEG